MKWKQHSLQTGKLNEEQPGYLSYLNISFHSISLATGDYAAVSFLTHPLHALSHLSFTSDVVIWCE